jgi:hypothetical protein
MHDTHTLAEWAAFLSLGLSMASAATVPFVLLVEADCWAWPNWRPLAHRALESGRVDPLLCAVANGRFDVCEAVADVRQFARLSARDAALTVAALLALLTITPGDAR